MNLTVADRRFKQVEPAGNLSCPTRVITAAVSQNLSFVRRFSSAISERNHRPFESFELKAEWLMTGAASGSSRVRELATLTRVQFLAKINISPDETAKWILFCSVLASLLRSCFPLVSPTSSPGVRQTCLSDEENEKRRERERERERSWQSLLKQTVVREEKRRHRAIRLHSSRLRNREQRFFLISRHYETNVSYLRLHRMPSPFPLQFLWFVNVRLQTSRPHEHFNRKTPDTIFQPRWKVFRKHPIAPRFYIWWEDPNAGWILWSHVIAYIVQNYARLLKLKIT